jgi:lipopolysaccharide transport system ATP-binding protein
MTDTMISVEKLGKKYRIGVQEPESETLGQTLKSALTSPFRYLRTMTRRERDEETLWAIRDISFNVKVGEAVGLIGQNGAGKSTLLKILARITEPTEGRAVLHGRMGSLLEVGTGFHQDLTGRENVYMNGAILGMSKAEIDRKFDEIVAFSEVEKFLDTPVKRYSSGMRVRLAFAVAAHLEPEILIVDEVLSVGDVSFQRKCLGKMGEITSAGRTVIYVSHNLGSVQSFCQRAIWLQSGRVRGEGPTDRIIANYLDAVDWSQPEKSLIISHDGRFEVTGLRTTRDDGSRAVTIHPGEALTVEISYVAHQPLNRPYFWLGFSGSLGSLFTANMMLDGARPERLVGRGVLRLRIPRLPLMPNQQYVIRLGGYESDGITQLFQKTDVAYFRVVGSAQSIGFEGHVADRVMMNAPSMLVPYTWELPDGRVVSVDPFKHQETLELQSSEMVFG